MFGTSEGRCGSALVNRHRLDNKNLERLIHTYLGDWIRTQEQGAQDHR
ncbi:MAG: hypothetical protein IPK44_16345 [Candidatus Accumulibacter sp.]|nr:hypothetical protein [Accumulibacter sp.]MBK8115944.1 hypothetical protein [Accumulibacter sp.]